MLCFQECFRSLSISGSQVNTVILVTHSSPEAKRKGKRIREVV